MKRHGEYKSFGRRQIHEPIEIASVRLTKLSEKASADWLLLPHEFNEAFLWSFRLSYSDGLVVATLQYVLW